MKLIFHYFLLFVALTATTGCDKDDNYYPAPKFEEDPTAEYIEANVDFDTQTSQEMSDSYYTYFCLCNASDHKFTSLLHVIKAVNLSTILMGL